MTKTANVPVQTFSILLKGEKGVTFKVAGWEGGMTIRQAAAVLSFVTGYRPTWIETWIESEMGRSRLGVAEVRPAACIAGEAPSFLVTRDNPIGAE